MAVSLPAEGNSGAIAYTRLILNRHFCRPYRPSRTPYRPSRVSGNPAAAGWQWAGLFNTVRDSRLRGNDGSYGLLTVRPYRPTANSAAHTSPGPGICWPVRISLMG